MFSFQPNVGKAIKASLYIHKFVKTRIDEHRETFDTEDLRDLVDVCLDNQQKEIDAKKKTGAFGGT